MKGAIVALDQSAAYDVISHDIMKRKLIHIGLGQKSVDLIMSYLSERKQYVKINTHDSDILLTGDQSVGQGSVSSGLLYLIFTLDMAMQTHNLKHNNHSEYSKCLNHFMNTYVDDCFALIRTENNNLWQKIEEYIVKMNLYYINNELQINVSKTNVMVISDNEEDNNNNITIEGNKIENCQKIKILGTTLNPKLNWNDHINVGRDSLISQLK